jgi:polyhydroxyalkanoate synthesis regulator phasin
MGWFGAPKEDPKIEELTEEIKNLSVQVASLKGERDGLKGVRALEAERQLLQEQIEKLKIEKGRADEENARKVRDAEHQAGLYRKQSEHLSRRSSRSRRRTSPRTRSGLKTRWPSRRLRSPMRSPVSMASSRL